MHRTKPPETACAEALVRRFSGMAAGTCSAWSSLAGLYSQLATAYSADHHGVATLVVKQQLAFLWLFRFLPTYVT